MESTKYLIYSCKDGWTNRVVDIISCILYCQLTHRVLIIDDYMDDSYGDGTLENKTFFRFFRLKKTQTESIEILKNDKNIEVIPPVWGKFFREYSIYLDNKNELDFEQFSKYEYGREFGYNNPNTPDPNILLINKKQVVVYSERFIYYNKTMQPLECARLLRKYYNNDDKIINNFARAFFEFIEIKEDLLLEAKTFVVNNSVKNIVGAHFRYCDDEYFKHRYGRATIDNIISLKKYVKKYNPETVYVGCDLELLFEKIKSAIKTNILRIPRIKHYDKTIDIEKCKNYDKEIIAREALLEALVLSYCKQFFPTLSSGYSSILIPTFSYYLRSLGERRNDFCCQIQDKTFLTKSRSIKRFIK